MLKNRMKVILVGLSAGLMLFACAPKTLEETEGGLVLAGSGNAVVGEVPEDSVVSTDGQEDTAGAQSGAVDGNTQAETGAQTGASSGNAQTETGRQTGASTGSVSSGRQSSASSGGQSGTSTSSASSGRQQNTASVEDKPRIDVRESGKLEEGMEPFSDIDEMKEAAGLQEYLEKMGFGGMEPIYTYYQDLEDDPEFIYVELYFDEAAGKGCGIQYQYIVNTMGYAFRTMASFSFDEVLEETGEVPDYYLIGSWYEGETGEGVNGIENFSETYVYDEMGRLEDYSSKGLVTWLEYPEEMTIIHLHYDYRPNGRLRYRYYHGNGRIFGTGFSTVRSYFDEVGRVQYEDAYITHGSLKYFYIYLDDDAFPEYRLSLDNDIGNRVFAAMRPMQ